MAEEKKTKKPVEKKPGFFKGVKIEAQKVTWYPRAATIKNTIWVIVAMVIIAGAIGLVDVGLQALLGLFV